MQRCPICRARLHGASLCPRCGVDLELAQRAETTARSLEAQALAALLANDPEQAARHLQRAEQLKRHTTQQQISGMSQQSQLAEKAETDPAPTTTHQIPPIQARRWWI